ncbi:hypothetical protein C8Q77DRAFT_1211097 [Trametes polyzona]|nr:hypothetical protein C8Q77DRAFT_1211097 [Trametes polyzona]
MGTTVLCDLDQFERDVLPSLPPEKLQHIVPTDAVDKAKATLSALFYEGGKKPKEVKEDHIAETVVDKVLNKIAFPSKYKVALSRFKYDSSDPSRAKVDAAIYPADRVPSNEAPDWTHCRFLIEFKKGDTKYDPWNDDESKNVEAERESRAAARAQLIAYARNVFLYQQRTALFTLLIIGDEFRVSRWDRSGVIVTKKVNYGKDPKRLLEVVWHLVQLDDEQQGMDPSATLIEKDSKAFKIMDLLAIPNPELDIADYMEGAKVTVKRPEGHVSYSDPPNLPPDPDLDEVEEVDDDPRVFKYVRDKFRDSLVDGWPRYKLRVGPKGRVFLVGKPIFCSSTMFGRATEGFIAVEARTRRFAFLKESWRPFYEGVEPEGRYLEMFADFPDMVVPAVLCHGDVAKQRAFAAVYEADPKRRKEESIKALQAAIDGAKRGKKHARPDDEQDVVVAASSAATVDDSGALRHHVHYRIAVKDVCLPFEEFRTTEQLIRLMYDCIKTHGIAYAKKNLLHRDISSGNVLILPRLSTAGDVEEVGWFGVLTDWELAKEAKSDVSLDKARQPERTGTWQFMSVAYVRSQCTIPVKVADELESFFYVLLFYAVRFIPHTISNVPGLVTQFFDTFQIDGKGGRLCSETKYQAVRDVPLRVQDEELIFLKTTGHPTNPLNQLIEKLRKLFDARYEVLDADRKSRRKMISIQGTSATRSTIKASSHITAREPLSWPGADDTDANDSDEELNVHFGHDSDETIPEEPSDRIQRRARRLDDHKTVLNLFLQTIRSTSERLWANTGTTSDKLVGYEPRITLVNQIRTSFETGTRNTSGSQAKRKKSSANVIATSSYPVHSMPGSSASGALPTTEEGDELV